MCVFGERVAKEASTLQNKLAIDRIASITLDFVSLNTTFSTIARLVTVQAPTFNYKPVIDGFT